MSKAIILLAEDWEGLYVDGMLVSQGHSINEGESRIKYILRMSKIYGFDIAGLREVFLSDADIALVEEIGVFPEFINEFNNNYEGDDEE
jgi:hypothetical protein